MFIDKLKGKQITPLFGLKNEGNGRHYGRKYSDFHGGDVSSQGLLICDTV
jgi:hypothetical protein